MITGLVKLVAAGNEKWEAGVQGQGEPSFHWLLHTARIFFSLHHVHVSPS